MGLFSYGWFGDRGQALPEAPFAVLDVETTGLSPPADRVVEIGVVSVGPRGEMTGEWSTVLHADGRPGADRYHGLAPRDRRDAPGFADVVDELLAQLGGHIMVAHNAGFEEGFLRAELRRARRVVPTMPALCTLRTARLVAPDLVSHRLAACCEHFSVPHAGAHTALGDARATAGLLGRLLAGAGPPRFATSTVAFPPAVTDRARPRPT